MTITNSFKNSEDWGIENPVCINDFHKTVRGLAEFCGKRKKISKYFAFTVLYGALIYFSKRSKSLDKTYTETFLIKEERRLDASFVDSTVGPVPVIPARPRVAACRSTLPAVIDSPGNSSQTVRLYPLLQPFTSSSSSVNGGFLLFNHPWHSFNFFNASAGL